MKIIAKSRAGKELHTFTELTETSTLDDLKAAYSKKFHAYYPDRQRWSLHNDDPKAVVTLGDGPLSQHGIKDGSVIVFKDLGPQIGYQTVFIVEYLWPMLAPAFYIFIAPFLHGTTLHLSHVQKLAFWAFTLHFLKRELETLFVHRFSHGTMPIFNIFKNSGYYWSFAFFINYYIFHPHYTAPSDRSVMIGLVIMIIAEIMNLICHIQLRNLRPAGSKERAIPHGLLFNLFSCPNYTMEILSWIGFSIMTSTLMSYFFTIVGAFQMTVWAIAKHKKYRKDFGKSYPRRWIIFPGF